MNERLYKDLRGKVDYILYFSNATKWGVLSVTNPLKDDPYFKDDTLIVTGNFDGVFQGCDIEFDGKYTVHPRYGAQIALTRLIVSTDTLNKESVVNFLSKSHIKGIDIQNAKKIWDTYKERSIDVVLNKPEELLKIKGIGEITYGKIVSSVAQYKRMEDLIKFCNNLGIPYNIIYKLDQILGEAALSTIKENIYSILEISDLITFSQIDAIAVKMGIKQDDPRRAEACLKYCLHNRVVLNSSTGCKNNDLKEDFYKKMGIVDIAVYNATLTRMIKDDIIVVEGAHVYLSAYYEKERFIAYALSNLLQTPVDNSHITDETIETAISSFPFNLNAQQEEAIRGILKTRVAVLTGGPGSGKSTITKALVDIYKWSGYDVYCLSPTGKATRRMTECTGFPASTIHKFLGCKGEPLETLNPPSVSSDSVLIIDESSMLDINMFSKILEIADTTPIRLILVGDRDQLPSVMAGNILDDLIKSDFGGIYRLTDIMRQAKNSHIIKYCADVNKGLEVAPCSFDDFIYREYYDKNDLYNDLMDDYMKEVREYGLMEVQVIAAYKKGDLGTINLNKEIASWYNKNPLDEKFQYRVGDKVMQITNDYGKNVFNGEVGICESIDLDDMEVSFQSGNNVKYAPEELATLMLAYASTCHKSQGAEYSSVFVILDGTSGNFLLTRKLLYTAMSRGKKKVYVLAMHGCFRDCVRNVFENVRITKLYDFLEERLIKVRNNRIGWDVDEVPF